MTDLDCDELVELVTEFLDGALDEDAGDHGRQPRQLVARSRVGVAHRRDARLDLLGHAGKSRRTASVDHAQDAGGVQCPLVV
jgi:hypothetical protein